MRGFFPTFNHLKLLHVSLVVAADLLDADVVLGLHVGLGSGVRPGQGHHADDVLEVLLVFKFDLQERGGVLCISERLITDSADAGLGCSGCHRNFTLAGCWDNEEGLDGNIATGGYEIHYLTPPLPPTRSDYSTDTGNEEMTSWEKMSTPNTARA